VAPGVLGISMDTGGYYAGSVGEHQMAWLEETLAGAHSGYFGADGGEVTTGNDDQLVIVFSHFNHRSMDSVIVHPERPDERRALGDEVVALFHRFPNVIAWVNGHHHVNEVQPKPDPSGRGGGFWDINTASHIDHPQHARLIEVVDNDDGTISIFCTMIDHAAPVAADYDDRSMLGLASISRELAANDPQANGVARLGTEQDLNVELVIAAPFDLRAAGIDGAAPEPKAATERTADAAGPSDSGDDVPVPALVGGAAAVAIAGVAGAVALRRRGAAAPSAEDPPQQ
jgi:metallophosphoesterase (TIGR03767 family)